MVGVSAASPGLAKEDRPAFLDHLERELSSGTHLTRVVLGSYVEYYDKAYRKSVRRRIDTEVYPGGQVKYLCVKGLFNTDWSPVLSMGSLFEKAFYADPSKIKSLAQGSPVRFTGIEVKDDRLEVALDTQGRVPHVKLKLMLGKGFQRQQTAETVMDVVSAALVVESYERVRQAQQEYAIAIQKLAEARALDTADVQGDAVQRLRAAEEHGKALEEAERVSGVLASLGRNQPDAAEYPAERQKVDETIAGLREAARTTQISAVNGSIQGTNREIDARIADLRSAATPQNREQTLARLDELLTRQGEQLRERAALGEPPSSEEQARVDRSKELVTKARAQAVAQKQSAERAQRLAQAEAAFPGLEKSVAAAREAYARAFGTPDQAAAARRLLGCLQQAYDNREAAGRAGSAAAAAQAAELHKEVERMRRLAR
jgi:hypothetical protein